MPTARSVISADEVPAVTEHKALLCHIFLNFKAQILTVTGIQ
jgi:hypothetical protein